MSLDLFRKCLAQSGILSEEDLRAILNNLPAADRPDDAKGLARYLVKAGHLTEYQARILLQGKAKGLVFGNYLILDRIGAGGMGVVLKARHRKMDRIVAVKVLPEKTLKSAEAVDRFYREVRAAARLSHPNIVAAYDADEADGTHYFVMEYVDGQDLAHLVKQRGPLPVDEAIDYTLQAARGLGYAHDQGIVHRDIKPANLLLDASGTVKILDMGLARFEQGLDEEDRDRLTQSGQVMGTCDYMAPEQAADTHRADRRADIYSLGCSLHRLLTGKPMYSGSTLVELLLAHRDQPIPSLLRTRPEVPPELDAVYRRMVAKRPEDRYQSMEEVAESLETCRVAVAAGPPGATPPAGEKSDSKLTAFVQGLSPAREETIRRQVDMETGEVTLPRTANARKAAPVWLYGTIAAGLVLTLTLVIGLLLRGGGHDDSSQVAQAPAETVSPPRDSTEPQPPQPESDRLIELTETGTTGESTDPNEPTLPEPPHQPEAQARPEAPPSHQPEAQPTTGDMPSTLREPAAPSAPKEDPAAKARRELLETQRAAEARYAAAMGPVEAAIAIWDFAAAWQAAEAIRFEEPELAARLETRRDEIRRMELLKRRIIAKISAADPPMRKSDLGIRGLGGEVTGAGPAGIATKTIRGEVEQLTWNALGTQAAGKLMELAVDPANGEDCVAAGLLAFAAGNQTAAERFFDLAKVAGADVSAQLAALAASALAQANDLLSQNEFKKAGLLLENLQSKHSDLTWFDANREVFEAAIAAAKQGVRDTEAEALYAEAVKFHQQGALFDLREVVKQLNTDYADCRPVTESSRTPSVAELTETVRDLGERFVVRQDGKGDHVLLQAAIDAALPNSLIEIQDSGPYTEKVVIPAGKDSLVLRGKKGVFPLLICDIEKTETSVQLVIRSRDVTVERFFFVCREPASRQPSCVQVELSGTRFRSCAFYAQGGVHVFSTNQPCELADCVFPTHPVIEPQIRAENSLFREGLYLVYGKHVFQHCTILGNVTFGVDPVELHDCILQNVSFHVQCPASEHRFISCVTLGNGFDAGIRGCAAADPQFRDPLNLDLRLRPGSPCIGKASDGGDIGCRYTPEMIEMCRIALELRAKGIIKF